MAKKKQREESGGYNYMDTYGDLVTLLLTFFVLLYSFSSVDQAKWKLLVESFTGDKPSIPISVELTPVNVGGNTFTENTSGSENESDEGDKGQENDAKTQEEINNEFDELYESIVQYIKENDLYLSLVVEKNEDTITVRVMDGIIFDSGSAQIKQTENTILNDIGEMFGSTQDIINYIKVEGHTDNVPISNSIFEDNWDLSGKRATNVVRYMQKYTSIPWKKFQTAGYGEYKPIATNDTAEGRMQNRRVCFIVERIIVENEINMLEAGE